MELSARARRWLRGCAHGMAPAVEIGKFGLTPAVWNACKQALECHELLKIRFQAEKNRTIQGQVLTEIAEGFQAILVGQIGHVAILYRPREDPERRQYERELARLERGKPSRKPRLSGRSPLARRSP